MATAPSREVIANHMMWKSKSARIVFQAKVGHTTLILVSHALQSVTAAVSLENALVASQDISSNKILIHAHLVEYLAA
jgi:hypothetical protein